MHAVKPLDKIQTSSLV